MPKFNTFDEAWFEQGDKDLLREDLLATSSVLTTSLFSRFRSATKAKFMAVMAGIVGLTAFAVANDQSRNDSSNIDSQVELTAPLQVTENIPTETTQLAAPQEPQEPQNTESIGQLGQQPPDQAAEVQELQRLIVRNPGLSTINYTSTLPGAIIPNPEDLTALSIPLNELAGKILATSALNTGINIRQIQNGELVDTDNNLSRNFNQLTATGQVVIGVETNENGTETPISFLQVSTPNGQEMWISGTSLRQSNPQTERVTNPNRTQPDSPAAQPDSNLESDNVIELTEADLVEDSENPSTSVNLDPSSPQPDTQAESADTQIEPEEADRTTVRPNPTREEYELVFLGFADLARQARHYLYNTDATPEQNSLLFSIEAGATESSDTAALQGLVEGGHSLADLWIILPNVTRLREEILALGQQGIILDIPESLNEVFSYEFAIPELVRRPVAEINRRLENLLVGFGDFKRMLNSDRVNQFIYNNQEATNIVERLKDQIDTSLDTLAIVMAMNINQNQPIIGPLDEIQTLLESNDNIVSLVQELVEMEFPIAMPDSITNNMSLDYLIPELQYGNPSADSVAPSVPAQDTLEVLPSTTFNPIDTPELDLPIDSKNSYQKFIDELSDSTLNQKYIGRQFEYTAKNGKTAVYTFKGLTKTGKIELKMPNSNLSIKINPSTLEARPNSISEVEFINWDDIEFTELSESPVDDIQFVTRTNIDEVTE
jgi:hypothetical protein